MNKNILTIWTVKFTIPQESLGIKNKEFKIKRKIVSPDKLTVDLERTNKLNTKYFEATYDTSGILTFTATKNMLELMEKYPEKFLDSPKIVERVLYVTKLKENILDLDKS